MNTIYLKENLVFKSKKNKIIILNVLSIIAIFTVIMVSVWEGQYSNDAHHWGLMLSNAKDFYEGQIPYKDIFIQYGILTTIIHAFSYAFLGGNLIGLILITSLFYGAGLWILYILAAYVSKSYLLAFYILMTAVLIHPVVIYPWSNYMAFPFLMMGVFWAIKYPIKNHYRFLSGLILGCAVLAREGLAPAVFIFLCVSIAVDCYINKLNNTNTLKIVFYSLIGFLFPFIIFSLYLLMEDLFQYWYVLSWKLPKIYANTWFSHMSGIKILSPLFNTLVNGIFELKARIIIFSLLFLTNFIVLFVCFCQLNKNSDSVKYFKIAIYTLLLASSALHSAEIFRMSTGSIVGLIAVYTLLKKFKIDSIFFSIISIILLIGIVKYNEAGNSFIPVRLSSDELEKVNYPKYFKNQRWNKNVSEYYKKIDNDLRTILAANCNIKYHFNYTRDTFLQIISPFSKYQIAPFYMPENVSALRPDIGHKEKMESEKSLIILQMVENIHRDLYKPPNDYFIYRKYFTPDLNFLPKEHTLLIMVPNDCNIKLNGINIKN